MLTSFQLHKKSSEVSIKTRSTPASLSIQGQDTKHTTVKWPIGFWVTVTSESKSSHNIQYNLQMFDEKPFHLLCFQDTSCVWGAQNGCYRQGVVLRKSVDNCNSPCLR